MIDTSFIKCGLTCIIMNKLEGMQEAFNESKQVFLTTTNKEAETRRRPMTNYNESPYEPMWFPSFKETQKIRDIEANPEVEISFHAEETRKWYKIKGKARLAPFEEVQKIWKWWFLEWVPEEERSKHELRYDNPFTDRSIIWVDPIEATISDTK